MPSLQAELRNNQKDWTSTGLECYQSGSSCEACPIYQVYGFHKNSKKPELKCHQPAANQALIAKGKPIPQELSNFSQARIAIQCKPIASENRTEREKYAALLREEIVRILPTMESPTLYEVINHLNQSKFMDRGWTYDAVNSQFHKMRKLGIIYTTRHEGRIGYWAVGDTSKLPMMLRQGRRTKAQMQEERERKNVCRNK